MDGVILGAGHNGLILQAYLARAGQRTVCLERRDDFGGGLTTVEHPAESGFQHNIHSFFHRGMTHMPWYRELELERRGAQYVTPDLNVALLTADGRSLEWWTDFDRTVNSVAAIDAEDAHTLQHWRDRFRSIVREILIPEAQAPPLPLDERQRILQETEDGQLLWQMSRLSPLQFVQQHFRNPLVQAGLLFFNGLREVDLRLPGFGHHIPSLLASDAMAQMCLGGSRQLATALVNAIEEAGGEIRTGVLPRRILTEHGQVRGVELEDGERIDCRWVASSLNPQQTLNELCSDAPTEWASRAAAFQYNLLAPLFALNLNLNEPPQYRAAAAAPHLNRALMTIVGLEHVDQFSDIVTAHERGQIPQTVMWGSCPSQFDASQSPAGKHTAFMWEKLPYHLHGDASRWDAAAEEHGEQMLTLWRDHAPNLESAVIDRFVRSPADTQKMFWNMTDGDLLVGAFAGGQVGYHRPFPGAGHYRTCFDGLYLCGSCCHPGGNITGLPGYNCSQVLRADLGL